MTRTVARVVLWAHRRVAHYRDTRYLLLCALEGRKSGRVTIGESRLPAHMVLGTLRAHGVPEAELLWPQLSADELAVLDQLVRDVAADGELEPDDLDVLRGDIAAVVSGEDASPGAVAARVVGMLVQAGVVRRG